MTYGDSILTFDHVSLHAGSIDTDTFNTTIIRQLSTYFRIIYVATSTGYNEHIISSQNYEPLIKLRITAISDNDDAFEYVLYPCNNTGHGFEQDIQLRSGEYSQFTFSVINDTDHTVDITDIQFCPESREQDMAEVLEQAESAVNIALNGMGLSTDPTVIDGSAYYELWLTRDNIRVPASRAYIKMDGNLDVSGQLSAEALYAAYGTFADLWVDRLSTSRRIVLYLKKLHQDDNHIEIAEEHIYFRTSAYLEGPAIQAEDPYGAPLYWDRQVWEEEGVTLATGVTLGDDGYPRYYGDRIHTTTIETPYPIYIYNYNDVDADKASFKYGMTQPDAQGRTWYMPILTLGQGSDSSGRNKGYIYKDLENMYFVYKAYSGKEIGVVTRSSGYMDLYGMRRTTSMDFSNWDAGSFSEAIEGVDDPINYIVTFDSSGNPVKITHPDGHECAISW